MVHPLTYIAQVRQIRRKNDNLPLIPVRTMRPILPIKTTRAHGISNRAIVTIGIVHDADLVGLNRNMPAWSQDAQNWQSNTRCISSQLPAKVERKHGNMPNNTMAKGLTGFWMHVGRNGSVRVINGTMYRLLSAKRGNILTRILSRRFALKSLRAQLYAKRCNRRADNTKSSYPRTYGLIGLPTRYTGQGWALSTTSRRFKAQRAQADMSLSTYSNPPFSRLTGLRDGSAFATLKDFQKRRKERQAP